MANPIINIDFDFGKFTKNINEKVAYINKVRNTILGHFSQIHNERLIEMVRDAVGDKFHIRKIRDSFRTQAMLRGFKIKILKSTGYEKNYKITHDFYDGKDTEFKYNKKTSIMGSSILNMINFGRKTYKIPRANNNTANPMLHWSYGIGNDILYNWKLRGRINVSRSVSRSKSKIYNKGINFFGDAYKIIEKFVKAKIQKINEAIRNIK